MSKTIPYFILFILLYSCDQSKQSVVEINIPEIIDNNVDLNLSHLFTEVSYTQLQTGKDMFINQVKFSVMEEDFNLIYDRKGMNLYQFNGDGTFEKQFLQKGRGPGEFFEISDMDANDNKELLVVRNGQFIDIMKLDRSLINTIKLTVTPKAARWITDDVIVLIYPYPRYLNNDGFEICFMNRDGRILKRTLKHPTKDVQRGRSGKIILGFNNEEMYYWSHQSDTIYTISRSLEVSPRCVLTHDNRHIPVEKYKNKNFQPILENQYTVESYDEWSEYIFITVAYNYHFVRGIVNSKMNLAGNCIEEYDKWTFHGLLNDIDGGIPFWPGKTHKDGSLSKVLDPLTLFETVEHNLTIGLQVDTAKQNFLKDSIVRNISIYSNPIIMTVRK